MAHELTLPRKSNGNFIPRLLFKGVYQINELWLMNRNVVETTGVDLSKILAGQTKILGGQKVAKSDKCMGVSRLLGARAWAAPKVYAYGRNYVYRLT